MLKSSGYALSAPRLVLCLLTALLKLNWMSGYDLLKDLAASHPNRATPTNDTVLPLNTPTSTATTPPTETQDTNSDSKTKKDTPFEPTFRLILQCRHCHGKIRNPDYPKFDDEDNAIFSCSKCGGEYREVLAKRTDTETPYLTSFKKPQPIHEQTLNLSEVKKTFTKWLYLENDQDIIDIVFAGFIQPQLAGDPVWYVLIAPSGGTKTEILRANQTDNAYLLDSLTPRTLVSGKIVYDENGKPKAIGGLLPQIDGKVLIVKDFTLILQKREEERNEIFSQLRCLYDGYLDYGYGNLPEPIRTIARIGFITACTPVIDFYTKLCVTLGERFLKVRHLCDIAEATKKAMENMGKEEQMRAELAETTKTFLNHLELPLKLPTPTTEQLLEIQSMANATAILRTTVTMKIWKGEVNEVTIGTVEVPTRLAKQLLKTAQSLAIVRGRTEVTEQDIETTRRVARDTCYPDRIQIIEAMLKNENSVLVFSTRLISQRTNIPLSTVWRELKELEYLGVVTCKDENWGSDGWALKNHELAVLFHKLQVEGGLGEKGSPVVSETPKTKPSIHFSRISASDTHKCDNCHGQQAEFRVGYDRYLCPSCFNEIKASGEANGANFVEETKPSNGEES